MIIEFENTQVELPVSDDSYRYRAIMGEHSLTLYYSLPEPVEIPVGATCEFEGQTYTLESPENFKKHHTRNFEYTLIMESAQAALSKYKFRDTTTRRLKFSLTAKPYEHLQMLVDNMNRRESGWTAGDCVDAVEKVISYNHVFCSDALSQIAEEFETEWEVVGKKIHLRKVEYNKDSPLSLSYGRGNGFKSGIGRSNPDDAKPVEILFVQGGERNIDASKYGSAELLLPKSQVIGYDGQYFSDQEEYDDSKERLYETDADGFSIRRSDKPLVSQHEDSLDCSHIYPSRVGTVSAVIVVDAEDHFYDFKDSSIPEGLDFSQYRIDGETMTVIFQSGMLTGREFEIEQSREAVTGYVHSERRFKLVPQEMDGRTMPDSVFKPAVGDTYAVFGMMLPDAYVCDDSTQTGASWDMFREAVKHLYENEDRKFTSTGELDGIWAKTDWLNIGGKIKPGGYVLFSDDQFQPEGVLIRIVGVKDYINNPHSPQIELSNSAVGGSIRHDLRKIDSNEVVVEDSYRDAVRYAKRRFRDSQETLKALQDAMLDGYSDSISPITVQTMAMLVGDVGLQFRFVDDKTSPSEVEHVFTWDQETLVFSTGAGIIQHMTLGIDSLKPSYAVSDYKFWDVSAFDSPPLTDAEKLYYVYIRVGKSATSGEFRLSEHAVKMEYEAGYYHFLVGILNSEFDGVRDYVSLYGFSEILPGQMRVNKVLSTDGTQYWDMLGGRFKIGDGSSFLSFNADNDGRLLLKGTLVQSQSGATQPLGCFRGAYSSSYTYYKGDEVTYAGSMYRFISDTAQSGVAPSNTAYWAVIAQKGTDGSTLYTWIKYADSGTGTGISDSPAGKKYIGIAANKTTATESSNPADYVWSLITGTDGVPGAPGADGQTLYTWIKYSDYPDDRGGIYDVPHDGTEYIGIATNKPTPTESTNFNDYVWSKFKGDEGVPGQNGTDGAFFEYRYAKNGSTTTPPALSASTANPSGWSTAMPSVGELEYLWMTVAKKTAAGGLLQNWSTPVRTSGADGAAGAKGDSPALVFRGVYSSTETYYGTSARVDAVKYNSSYYVARIDAGTVTGVLPTNTGKWNGFGTTFESVATGLLLAELSYIENLIVGRLSTGKDDSMPRLLAKDSEIRFYQNKAAESDNKALVRIGMDVGIMQALGDNRPGVIARAVNGDNKYAELTSAGLFVNGGKIRSTPAYGGVSAFSAAALLQERVDGDLPGYPGLNAAMYGWDTSATNYSNPNQIPALGFGGYFNKLCARGLYVSCRGITENTPQTTNQTTGERGRVIEEDDVFISMYNQSATTIYLTLPQTAGKLLFVRINNGINVTIDGSSYSFGKQIMLEGGGLVNSSVANVRGELITLMWDGSYWLYSSTAK